MFDERLFTAKGQATGCAIRVGFRGGLVLWVKVKTWRIGDPQQQLIEEDEYNSQNDALYRLDRMSDDPREEVEIRMIAVSAAKYLREFVYFAS